MKKGIQKYTICLIASLILVMPFSFNKTIAAEYSDVTMSYFFWSQYYFDTLTASDSYTVSQHGISVPKTTTTVNESTNIPTHNMTITTAGSSYQMNCTPANTSQNSSSYTCELTLNVPQSQYNETTTGTDTTAAYTMTESSYQIIANNSNPAIFLTTSQAFKSIDRFDNKCMVRMTDADKPVYYVSFVSNYLPELQIFSRDNETYTWSRVYRQSVYDAHDNREVHKQTYRIVHESGDSDAISINFTTMAGQSDVELIPIFNGFEQDLTEDMRVTIGLGSIAQYGDIVSQASTSAADQSNQSLGTSVSNLSTIEDQYNQDLNTQLNQIDFTDHITTQQGFLSSSTWVINTFNTLIANNPFTWLIVIVSIFYVFKRFN